MSKEFKKIRDKAFWILVEEQQWKCLRCGRDLKKLYENEKYRKLHVHHIDRSGGTEHENNSIENLCLLCNNCHDLVHLRVKRGRMMVPVGNERELKFFELEIKELKEKNKKN